MSELQPDDPLQDELRLLKNAFAVYEELTAVSIDTSADFRRNTLFQESLGVGMEHALQVGVGALRRLVEKPDFYDVAVEAAKKAADDSPEVEEFLKRWLPEESPDSADTDAEATEAALVLLSRLRMAAPIGHTAIGWAFGEAYDVRTYSELQEFFADAEPVSAPPATAEQQDDRPVVALAFEPDYVAVSEGTDTVNVLYYGNPGSPVVLARQESKPVTIADLRREITKQALRWYEDNPNADLPAEAFHDMIQAGIGTEYKGKMYALYDRVRQWWRASFITNAGAPIIEWRDEDGKPRFSLNSAVRIQVTSPQAESQ